MKLKHILWEVQQPTSKHFDTFSPENVKILDVCRELCASKGYPLNNQHDEMFFKQHGTLKNIAIDSINIGQKKVSSDMIDRKGQQMDLINYKPIHVFKYNGKLYLHDGHHRTVNLKNNDVSKVKGYIVNVNKL